MKKILITFLALSLLLILSTVANALDVYPVTGATPVSDDVSIAWVDGEELSYASVTVSNLEPGTEVCAVFYDITKNGDLFSPGVAFDIQQFAADENGVVEFMGEITKEEFIAGDKAVKINAVGGGPNPLVLRVSSFQTYNIGLDIGEHGSISLNGKVFTNKDSVAYLYDASIPFTCTPDEGYRVSYVKIGGVRAFGGTQNTIIINISEPNTTIEVAFEPIPSAPTSAEDEIAPVPTNVQIIPSVSVTDAGGQPTVLTNVAAVYASVSLMSETTVTEIGAVVTNKENASQVVLRLDPKTDLSASGKFGVFVFGEGIKTGVPHEIRTYIKYSDGTVKESSAVSFIGQ